MGISWSFVWWIMGLWAAGWVVAKVVSIRKGWDRGLVEYTWVRSCCLAAGAVPVMQQWSLLLLPLLLWAHRDAEEQLETATRRRAEWHSWADDWSKTEYLWQRRVPKRP